MGVLVQLRVPVVTLILLSPVLPVLTFSRQRQLLTQQSLEPSHLSHLVSVTFNLALSNSRLPSVPSRLSLVGDQILLQPLLLLHTRRLLLCTLTCRQ